MYIWYNSKFTSFQSHKYTKHFPLMLDKIQLKKIIKTRKLKAFFKKSYIIVDTYTVRSLSQ